MSKLPPDVADELDKLFYADPMPSDAMNLREIVKEKGGSITAWRLRLQRAMEDDTWKRGRRAGYAGYYYWPIDVKESE